MGEAQGQQEIFIKLYHIVLSKKPKPSQASDGWVVSCQVQVIPITRHTF